MTLHASQSAALEHVASHARGRAAAARETIEQVRRMANLQPAELERAVAAVRQHARVALHFHPDRLDDHGRSVAASLFASGVYKSQFETLLSSGSVSAFPGGARDRWEHRLFGGAYQQDGTTNAHRPKYGSLDLLRHPDGPSPRFGACYFLLAPEVTARATLCHLDSHQDPPEKGTIDEFDDIFAALLAEAFTRESALGERPLRPPQLVARLAALGQPFPDPASREPRRSLDHYVEAQVHGEIRLDRDVEILVADPSFLGTETGACLDALCNRYQIRCLWHAGFALAPADVPADFRGPTMPSLAARVAGTGRVDAATIGRAAVELKRNPAAWADRGRVAEVLQELKLLWHVVVRYGKPHGPLTGRSLRSSTASALRRLSEA